MPPASSSQLLPCVTSLFPGKLNSCFAPHSPATNFIPLASLQGAPSSSEKCEHPYFPISRPEQLSRKAARASLLLLATFAPNPGQGQHPGARFQLFQLPRGTHGCSGGGNRSSKGSGRLLAAHLRPLLFGKHHDEDFVFLRICTALDP